MTQIQTVEHLTTPEQTQNPESLTDAQLNGYLAAVGNHEVKALFLTAMVPGEEYGRGGAHKLFLDMQGGEPARTLNPGVPFEYLEHSFEPIGAVAKVRLSDTIKYELDERNGTLGKSVAGHMLNFSLNNPDVSLNGLLSVTTGIAPELRSPKRRFEIFEELLTENKPVGVRELAGSLDWSEPTLYNHLRNLDKSGLVTLNQVRGAKTDAVYGVSEPLSGKHSLDVEPSIAPLVAQIIDRQDQSELSSSEIEALVLADEYYSTLKPRSVVNRVRRVLLEFARNGDIVPLQPRVKTPLTEVYIVEQYRKPIEEMTQLIYDIQENSAEFYAEGLKKADEIIQDVAKVKYLVAKGIDHSPQANYVPKEERIAAVLTAIREHNATTSSEIQNAASEVGMTRASTQKTLDLLRKSGVLQSLLVRNENIWSFADQDVITSKD